MAQQIAVGVPQYGSKKKNNFKIQDGENVYRILPPLGELASDGIWAVYECIHWGYKGSRGARPFRCIQKKDFKTKMIKVQCPECDRIAEITATMEAHKAKLIGEGKTEDYAKEQVKPLADWLYSHNLDKKWQLNAMTLDGKIGKLPIPHKMYVQLQEVISDLVNKKGVDPISVDGGVYFNLVRSGKGNQTSHRVAVVEESVMADVGGKKMAMNMIKPAPLTGEILARLGAEAYDLKNAFRSLTYDEIRRIVSSEGDPEIVDSIFSSGDVQPKDAPDADEPDPGAVAASVNVSKPVTVAPQTVVVAPAAVPTVVVAPTLAPVDLGASAAKAQFEAQMKALQEQMAKLASSQTTITPTTTTVVPAQTVLTVPVPVPPPAASMSDDDFIRQFGFSVKK